MKKVYEAPVVHLEQFVANEYIAACGEKNEVYKFKCDAPAGTLYYYPWGDGTIDGKYTGNEQPWWLGSYHPCSKEHEASKTSDFYDGFVDYNRNGKHDDGEGVIVWRGRSGWDGHATKNLDMKTWETTKS